MPQKAAQPEKPLYPHKLETDFPLPLRETEQANLRKSCLLRQQQQRPVGASVVLDKVSRSNNCKSSEN